MRHTRTGHHEECDVLCLLQHLKGKTYHIPTNKCTCSYKHTPCTDPKVLSEGVQLYTSIYFTVDEDPNTTISGQSSAHQQNAIKMAIGWLAYDGPTLNAGLVAL